jgi:hypothetical protein
MKVSKYTNKNKIQQSGDYSLRQGGAWVNVLVLPALSIMDGIADLT